MRTATTLFFSTAQIVLILLYNRDVWSLGMFSFLTASVLLNVLFLVSSYYVLSGNYSERQTLIGKAVAIMIIQGLSMLALTTIICVVNVLNGLPLLHDLGSLLVYIIFPVLSCAAILSLKGVD